MKEYIVQAIDQETIDAFDVHNAPELIRCMDCKHLNNPDSGVPFCKHIKKFVSAYWFCADSERKEGVHE